MSIALLNPFSGLAIDNFASSGSGPKHPITHEKQYYIVPSDCQNGDNVGKVYELWTDRRFNDRGGDSYAFEIFRGNTNNSFSIDRRTGELMVRNASGIKGDVTLVVKVSIGGDSQLSTVHIKRVNSSDIVYIDSGFSGTSTGSRSAPYKSFKSSGQKNGQSGKYYLYRRNRTYNHDILVIYNGETSARITIGAWGSGARPVLDGQNKFNSAIQLGSAYFSSIGLDKTAFNVDVMDLEFKRYERRTIELPRKGKNFNFRRLKLGNTTAMNGLIWLAHQLNPEELYPSNIYGSDIELYGFRDRGMKIERGGDASKPVLFENIKAHNGSKQAYVSATDNPYVTLRYLDVDHGSTAASGPDIRYGQNNLEWAYIKGAKQGIFVWKRDNKHSKVKGAHIRDVIIDGTVSGDGIMIEKGPGASQGHENIEINRVEIRNSGRHGINIQQGAKNVTLSYVLIYNSKHNGVMVDRSTSGIKTHNSIITDSRSRDIWAAGNTDVKNTIYQSKYGALKEEKNTSETGYFKNKQKKDYRPKSGAPYLNQGSVLGYKFDLEGNKIPSKPTLGAFELASGSSTAGYRLSLDKIPSDEAGNVYMSTSGSILNHSEKITKEGGTIYGLPEDNVKIGEKVKVVAEAIEGYKFENWSHNGKKVSEEVSYEFKMPKKNLSLTANFRVLEESEESLNQELVDFYEMNNNDSNILKDSLGANDETYRTIQSEIFGEKMVSKGDLEQGPIDKQYVQLEYLIGPNPTTDQINVMFTNLDGDYEFEIRTISMNGHVLEEYHAKPQNANIILDVADLNPGVYILQLNYKGKMISSRKFIKQ